MLHHQLGHDLPGVTGGGVGVVGAVDLALTGPGDDLLGLAGVHEGADHVDVTVEDVVLGVLVDAVDAFLSQHDGHVGAGHAGNVAVVVDGTADFFLDHVEGLALGADLLTGDGNTAHALRSTLDEAVHVALTGGTDDHDVVGAVMGSHAHTADIILETSGGNLGGDGGHGLRIDVIEIMGGHQAHGVAFHVGGDITILEGALLQLAFGGGLAPGPAAAAGMIMFKILQNLFHVDTLGLVQLVIRHSLPLL